MERERERERGGSIPLSHVLLLPFLNPMGGRSKLHLPRTHPWSIKKQWGGDSFSLPHHTHTHSLIFAAKHQTPAASERKTLVKAATRA